MYLIKEISLYIKTDVRDIPRKWGNYKNRMIPRTGTLLEKLKKIIIKNLFNKNIKNIFVKFFFENVVCLYENFNFSKCVIKNMLVNSNF